MWHFTIISLIDLGEITCFQMLCNVKGMNPNFETLRDKNHNDPKL